MINISISEAALITKFIDGPVGDIPMGEIAQIRSISKQLRSTLMDVMPSTTKNTIITVTGPSLSGKTTLVRALLDKFEIFKELVSHTTRPMRAGEIEGKDYFFVTRAEFVRMTMAEQVEFGGHLYGISDQSIDRAFGSGRIPLLICEPNGANQIARYCSVYNITHVSIYVATDEGVRFQRFLQRFKEDTNAQLENYTRRLLLMKEETSWLHERDWDILVGGAFPYTYEDLEGLVAKIATKQKGGVSTIAQDQPPLAIAQAQLAP